MSSEPIASGAASSEVRADATAQAEFDADVEQVLIALGRLDATIRGERGTLGRLRGALRDMAGLLGQAKQSMQPDAKRPLDIGMLLDELEHRLDTMIGLAEAAPTRAQPRVPTVSGVVSRLGRVDDRAADTGQRQGPTVSELAAMVQALSASVPAAPETAAPEPSVAQPAVAEPIEPAASPPIDAGKPIPEPPPEPAARPPQAASPEAEAEVDDVSVFLFGPDLPAVTGDWKAQPPGPTPALPVVDLVTPAPAKARDSDAVTAPKKQSPDPNDPLASLNAMSEWERLALFS